MSCAEPGNIALLLCCREWSYLYTLKHVQDLNMVGDYWGWYNSRSYHHTGMVSTWCVVPAFVICAAKG